jgi:probable selenate reductase FAD-binding subunit
VSRIQEYVRAGSIEEALALKAQLGEKAFFLAGGTDVLVFTPPDATTAIDITRLGLDGVRRENGAVLIGATAILRDVERHPEITTIADGALVEAIRETGPWLIRNAGTLAGNLCNASPSADSVPMLLALDATVTLSDGRTIPLDQFLIGPHKTILGNELATQIRIEPRSRRGHFHKLSRSKSDIAQVNLAVTARLEDNRLFDVRIALGSVGPTAVRARQSEGLLEGEAVAPALLDRLTALVRTEISPIDDWRATAEYRRHAAGVMVARAVRSLLPV